MKRLKIFLAPNSLEIDITAFMLGKNYLIFKYGCALVLYTKKNYSIGGVQHINELPVRFYSIG